jgi:molecular chaperone Hsp33
VIDEDVTDSPLADDLIQPFRVDALDLHGRHVRLGNAVDTILARHNYPAPVAVLLGEALALTAALAGALKFDGTFSTQVQGDGPVRLLLADYATDGALRGYAGFDEDKINALPANPAPAAAGDAGLFGAGHLAFTVDQDGDHDRYQGLVPLEGDTLAGLAGLYLTRSEQLRADVEVAATLWPGEAGQAPHWCAGCLLVQQAPTTDGRADDDADRGEAWSAAHTLFARLHRADLADPLAIPPALIGPLYRGHDVRLHESRPLRFACRCSAERALRVIAALDVVERADLAVDGKLEMTCDYCNALYLFDTDGQPIEVE